MKVTKLAQEKRQLVCEMLTKESVLTEITTTSLNPYVFYSSIWHILFRAICYYDWFKGLRFVIPPTESAKFFDIIEKNFDKLDDEFDKDEREVKNWREKVTYVLDPALNGLNTLSFTIYTKNGIRMTYEIEG